MTALAVVLALLSALGNALASVLQRRAAATEQPAAAAARFAWLAWLVRLLHRPVWLWGFAAMVMSGLCQAAALAVGALSIVQPVLTTELLFTLAVGTVVFHRPAGRRTWWAFLAMAVGLAVFLALAHPSPGRVEVPPERWLLAAGPTLGAVLALILVSLRLRSTPRAVTLATATAIGFSFTAALLKDATGRLTDGVDAMLTSWPLYTAMAVGLFSFLLLQATLRAGTLVVSQPALTLGDALLSVVLGAVLFDERVTAGWRVLPEAAALALLVLGSVQVARSPLVSGASGASDASDPGREQHW